MEQRVSNRVVSVLEGALLAPAPKAALVTLLTTAEIQHQQLPWENGQQASCRPTLPPDNTPEEYAGAGKEEVADGTATVVKPLGGMPHDVGMEVDEEGANDVSISIADALHSPHSMAVRDQALLWAMCVESRQAGVQEVDRETGLCQWLAASSRVSHAIPNPPKRTLTVLCTRCQSGAMQLPVCYTA